MNDYSHVGLAKSMVDAHVKAYKDNVKQYWAQAKIKELECLGELDAIRKRYGLNFDQPLKEDEPLNPDARVAMHERMKTVLKGVLSKDQGPNSISGTSLATVEEPLTPDELVKVAEKACEHDELTPSEVIAALEHKIQGQQEKIKKLTQNIEDEKYHRDQMRQQLERQQGKVMAEAQGRKDDQGMVPNITTMAKDLAESHWTGFTGATFDRLLRIPTATDHDGNLYLRANESLDFIHDLHNRVGIHFFKHGIEWVKDHKTE